MASLLARTAAISAAALVLVVPSLAQAFCRTTTAALPASYSPTRGCFTEGLPLYWKNACVSFSINARGTSRIPYETAASVIEAAFATWSDVTCASGTKVGITLSSRSPVDADKVRYSSEGPNQNLVVFREDAWPYNDPNNTLGLTTVTMNTENGEIFDADLEINATGANLTAGDPVPSTGYDLASVVTHEAGHFLGLAHATDGRATMFASYRPGTTALRTLTPDDIAGACAIYPSDAERAVDARVAPSGVVAADACNDEPRHGFGSTNDAPPGRNRDSGGGDGGGCAVAAHDGPRAVAPAHLALAAALAALVGRRRRRS